MKDKTMVLLAVWFMAFTVGTGVNLSLEACSRMVGRPLAAGPEQVVLRQAALMYERVREYTVDFGRVAGGKARVLEAEARKTVLLWMDRLKTFMETIRPDRFPKKNRVAAS